MSRWTVRSGIGPVIVTSDEFQAILAGARAGDDRSFAKLWRRFNAPLQRYLRVVASTSDIDDLASITWMEVVRGLDRFSGGEAEFRAWLFTIARLRLLDQRRHESRRVRTVGSDDPIDAVDAASDPQVLTEAAAGTEAALAAIRELPADQAEIVALRVIAGFDVNEVAEITGKKPGTVRVIAHRAVKRLAAQVGVDGTPTSGASAADRDRGRDDTGDGTGGVGTLFHETDTSPEIGNDGVIDGA